MSAKYSCVRQRSQCENAAAALATASERLNVPVRLRDLRVLAKPNELHVFELFDVLGLARRFGFWSTPWHGSFEELRSVPLPALAVLRIRNAPHYVVIDEVRPNEVTMADPAAGVLVRSRNAFCALWTGDVVALAPDEEVRGTLQAELRQLRNPAAKLAYTLLCAVVVAATLLPTLLGDLSTGGLLRLASIASIDIALFTSLWLALFKRNAGRAIAPRVRSAAFHSLGSASEQSSSQV